jgi:hypothetical protein
LKKRLSTSSPVVCFTPEIRAWLADACPLDCATLEPKIWIAYRRMTLVSHWHCERVTLDTDLAFFTADRMLRMDRIVVAEVKMDSTHKDSPFLAQMRTRRVPRRSFSKYAIGMSLLEDGVKKNNIKPQLLSIEKMQKGAYGYA